MTLRGGTKSGWLLFVLSLAVVVSLIGVVSFGMVGSERGVAPALEQGQSEAAEAVLPEEVQDAAANQPSVTSSAVQQDVQPAATDPAPATESSVIPPDKAGPYHVGYYFARYQGAFGTYLARIRYPATSDGYLAPKYVADGPYPGVVIGPSYATVEWFSTWNGRHLASHGYVTVSFTPPWPLWIDPSEWAAGFNGGIDKLKAENGRAGSPIAGLVDVQKFGIMGLSMGGGGCIEAAGTNPEVDCAVALAPVGIDADWAEVVYKGKWQKTLSNAAKNIKIPIQLQLGTNDALVGPMPHGVAYYYSPLIPDTTPKEYVEIKGANHVGFIDPFFASVATFFLLDKPCLIGVEEQHRISERYFTSWFNYFLKGQQEYGTYIFGAEAQKDVSAGVLSQFKNNLP